MYVWSSQDQSESYPDGMRERRRGREEGGWRLLKENGKQVKD